LSHPHQLKLRLLEIRYHPDVVRQRKGH
jgi:hypothetical protein